MNKASNIYSKLWLDLILNTRKQSGLHLKWGVLKKIENVQRRATKQVPTLKNIEYNERLKKLKMPTLKYKRMRAHMIEVFKIINGIYDPLTTVDMFELNTTSNTRGHSKKMKIKQVD